MQSKGKKRWLFYKLFFLSEAIILEHAKTFFVPSCSAILQFHFFFCFLVIGLVLGANLKAFWRNFEFLRIEKLRGLDVWGYSPMDMIMIMFRSKGLVLTFLIAIAHVVIISPLSPFKPTLLKPESRTTPCYSLECDEFESVKKIHWFLIDFFAAPAGASKITINIHVNKS